MLGQARFGEVPFAGSPIEIIYRGSLSSFGFQASARPVLQIKGAVTARFLFTTVSKSAVRVSGLAASFLFETVSKPTILTSGRASFRLSGRAEPSLPAQGSLCLSFRVSASPAILALSSIQIVATARLLNAISRLAFAFVAEPALRTSGASRSSFRATASAKISAPVSFTISASASVSPSATAQAAFISGAIPTLRLSGFSAISINATASPHCEARSPIQIAVRAKGTVASLAHAFITARSKAKAAYRARAELEIQFSTSSRPKIVSKTKASFLFIANATPSTFATARSRFGFASKARTFLQQFQAFEIGIRLKVRDVDLSHRVVSWTLRFEHDPGSWVLDVVFTNHALLVEGGEGLAPWDPISRYNEHGPLLGSYNPVTLEIYRPGLGWKKIFTGWAGPATVSAPEVWGEGDQLRATFVGISQPLKDWIIEERLALRYTKAAISKQGQPDLLNRIVMDQGFDVEIHYRDDPMFMVDEYIISGVSLWEALTNALAPTGFRLVEWWDPATGETKLTVIDPLRFKTEPDVRIVGGFSARNISGNESEVRTWVGVVYRDRYDFQEKLVWAESSPEILNLYGIPDGKGGRKHKKMVYRTSERSLIDTESEARELASVILWDVETPCPSVEITFPMMMMNLLPFQLVEVIGENFSTLVGITEIEHSWSWDRPCGQTIVRGARGRVVGAKHLWFTRDVRREGNRERILIENVTEPALSLQPNKPFVVGSFFQHQDGTPKPVVDIVFPPPPPWASSIFVKVFRMALKDSVEIVSMQGNTITVANRSYQPGQFSSASSDYFVLFDQESRSGPAYKIKTVSGNVVVLERVPEAVRFTNGLITRVKRIETKTYPLTRFVRLEDVTENELVMVLFGWIGRS